MATKIMNKQESSNHQVHQAKFETDAWGIKSRKYGKSNIACVYLELCSLSSREFSIK